MKYFNNLSCYTTQKKKIRRQTKEERLILKCKFGLILKLLFFLNQAHLEMRVSTS